MLWEWEGDTKIQTLEKIDHEASQQCFDIFLMQTGLEFKLPWYLTLSFFPIKLMGLGEQQCVCFFFFMQTGLEVKAAMISDFAFFPMKVLRTHTGIHSKIPVGRSLYHKDSVITLWQPLLY